MDEDLFEDYDAPLDARQVLRLLRRTEQALGADASWLPEQEIYRLWWGTWDAAEPLKASVGLLYNELVDWQEKETPLDEAHANLVEQVRVLLGTLADEPW